MATANSQASTTDITGLNFGTNDFTMECWLNTTGATGSYQNIVAVVRGGARVMIQFGDPGYSNRLQISLSATTLENVYLTSDTAASLAGAWHHFALVRSSGLVKFYKDGVTQSMRNYNWSGGTVSAYTDTTNITGATSTVVGPVPGYVDDVRITNGVARYTADFTPPTQAFPNS